MSPYCFVVIISFCSLIKGQSLPEAIHGPETECGGGNPLRASCTSDHVIVVKDVQFGTKLETTCGLSNKSADCCAFDAADCLLTYSDTAQQVACSGKNLCSDVTVAQIDTSSGCGPDYPGLNHYLTMEYYCVPENRIAGSLSSKALSETDKPLYLWNEDYPNSVRGEKQKTDCSVETRNCLSVIDVYFVDFGLSGDSNGGECNDTQHTQEMQFEDNGVNRTFTCSDNNGYKINHTFTSSSNYLKITFSNPDGVNAGKFWIGFKDTDNTAQLTLNCPAVEQTMCMDCSSLEPIMNGSVSTAGGLSTWQNATYHCDPGFDIVGSTTRSCQENGTWSGKEPVCQIKECPHLTAPYNGSVTTPGGRYYGQTAYYDCHMGYSLVGNSTRLCKEDASWSGTDPTCEQIECPELNAPNNGNVTTPGGRYFGQTAYYECLHGYRLVGNSSRLCEESTSWSGTNPTCYLIVCPSLSDPFNGTVSVSDNSTVGQKANYNCNEGFRIEGDATRTCELNGMWSGTIPTCIQKTCQSLLRPSNGDVSTNGRVIGSSATYTCSVGYTLTGVQNRTCEADYQWSGTEPVCTARELGSDCAVEDDCLNVIVHSTCNNSICVCSPGFRTQNGACISVESGTTEKPDDGEVNPLYIIIPVAGALVLIVVIVIVVVRCRKRKETYKQGTDNPDQQKQHVPAFTNHGYSDHQVSCDPWKFDEITQAKHSVQNEVLTLQDSNGTLNQENLVSSFKQDKLVVNNHKTEVQTLKDDKAEQGHPPQAVNMLQNSDLEPKTRTQQSEEANDAYLNDDNEPAVKQSIRQDFDPNIPLENEHLQEEQNRVSVEEEQNQANEDIVQDQINTELVDMQSSTLEAMEKEIKEADLNLDIDEGSVTTSSLIKDVCAALFRSASVAKRNLIAQGKAGDYILTFETTDDGEWSKGLISAAKEVLAAIYAMCHFANELTQGKSSDDEMQAAVMEIKRTTNGLIIAYKLEGEPEVLRELKKACLTVNEAAEKLVQTTVKNTTEANETVEKQRKSVSFDGSEVQKAKQRIEVNATVVRKQKELQEAQIQKSLLNQELNKYEKESSQEMSTEL